MKRTLILVAGAALSIASAARPQKLAALPPGVAGALDPTVPTARRQLEKTFPDTKVVTAAPMQAEWTYVRNDLTGLVLRRQGRIGFGLQTGDRCWFQVRDVYQESLPDGWGPVELADDVFFQADPDNDGTHGFRYPIDCDRLPGLARAGRSYYEHVQ